MLCRLPQFLNAASDAPTTPTLAAFTYSVDCNSKNKPGYFQTLRPVKQYHLLLHREPPFKVAGILGQSVAVLLSTYAHYFQDDQERASRLMDEITTIATIDLQDCNRLQPIDHGK